jgi:hypothetical protein
MVRGALGHDLQAPTLTAAHQAQTHDLEAQGLGHGVEQLDQITVFLRLAAQRSSLNMSWAVGRRRPNSQRKSGQPFGPPLESATQR